MGAAQESVGRRTPRRYPTSGYPRGTAQPTDAEGNLRVRLDYGQDAEFNIRESPHFDCGYAVTSHSSHGAAADRVLVHVDTGKCRAERRSARGERRSPLHPRLAYVSVSRGRCDAQIYTHDAERFGEVLSRDVSKQLVATVSEFLTVGFSHASIPNSKQRRTRGQDGADRSYQL